MKIQKLNWAGIKLSVGGITVLIDAVENFQAYKPILGEINTLLFTDELQADYLLFTHLHLDHYDKALIAKNLKPNGKLIVFAPLKDQVREDFPSAEIIALELDEMFQEHGIVFKPVFAMDGIGDLQCSWIVEGGGEKIFHGGDTIWHNQFWRLGKENQDIDYAFLPANGVVVNFPMTGLEYSPVPASLTLEQAFAAARLLHARHLIPIHYGLFAHPQHYSPTLFTPEDLKNQSEKMNQPYLLLADGDEMK